MTGFKHNVLGGISHFFEHIADKIDDEVHAAIDQLKPLIEALTLEIKNHGVDVVKAAAAAAATAVTSAKAQGKSDSEAGHAALQAAESAAVAAGVALGTNALHAIATAQVADPVA